MYNNCIITCHLLTANVNEDGFQFLVEIIQQISQKPSLDSDSLYSDCISFTGTVKVGWCNHYRSMSCLNLLRICPHLYNLCPLLVFFIIFSENRLRKDEPSTNWHLRYCCQILGHFLGETLLLYDSRPSAQIAIGSRIQPKERTDPKSQLCSDCDFSLFVILYKLDIWCNG